MTLDIDRLRELLTTARDLGNPVASMKAWEELDQGSMLVHALTLLDALEAADADAESAYARGFHDAQTKARVEGRLIIVDSPELVELRAEIARLREALTWYKNQFCEGFCNASEWGDRGHAHPDIQNDCSGCRAAATLLGLEDTP